MSLALFFSLPCLLHTCCLRILSTPLSTTWLHSAIQSTGAHGELFMGQALPDAGGNVTNSTDPGLALGECLSSTLQSLLSSRLLQPDVFLIRRPKGNSSSLLQTSPSSCVRDLSRRLFPLPGSPNQRREAHPRLCPLPVPPAPNRSPVQCVPHLAYLLFSTCPAEVLCSSGLYVLLWPPYGSPCLCSCLLPIYILPAARGIYPNNITRLHGSKL